jgi:hypothetical protein
MIRTKKIISILGSRHHCGAYTWIQSFIFELDGLVIPCLAQAAVLMGREGPTKKMLWSSLRKQTGATLCPSMVRAI